MNFKEVVCESVAEGKEGPVTDAFDDGNEAEFHKRNDFLDQLNELQILKKLSASWN
jgi:hypothetical protein